MQLNNFNHEIHISASLLDGLLQYYGTPGRVQSHHKLQLLAVTFTEIEERVFVDQIKASTGIGEP